MIHFDWHIREELLIRDDQPVGQKANLLNAQGSGILLLQLLSIQGRAAVPKRGLYSVFEF